MTVGEKIKFIRVFRNLTQNELGSALGFAENATENRISQYEKGVRTPRADIVKQFAEQFSVPTFVLQDHIDDKVTNIIMQMFWNEIEMREYKSKYSAPDSKNETLTLNKPMIDSTYERIKQSTQERIFKQIKETTDSTDLLTRALIEYQETKQLIYTGIITFENFIIIMLNWDITSGVGKEIYKK